MTPSGSLRFSVVSSVGRAPGLGPAARAPRIPVNARRGLGGELPQLVFVQPGTDLVTFGTGVIGGYGPRGRLKYAFDLRSLGFPPRSLVPRA